MAACQLSVGPRKLSRNRARPVLLPCFICCRYQLLLVQDRIALFWRVVSSPPHLHSAALDVVRLCPLFLSLFRPRYTITRKKGLLYWRKATQLVLFLPTYLLHFILAKHQS